MSKRRKRTTTPNYLNRYWIGRVARRLKLTARRRMQLKSAPIDAGAVKAVDKEALAQQWNENRPVRALVTVDPQGLTGRNPV